MSSGINYYKDTLGHGWRSCLRCGKRGIKDTFYGRNKDYCSLGCSRFSISTRDYLFRNRNKLPFIKHNLTSPLPDLAPYLDKFEFAPVHAFPHTPLSKCWRQMFSGNVVIEICHETTGDERVWLARLVSHKGYYIKVQLVGKEKHYFLNPGQVNMFPTGYAAESQKRYGVPFKNLPIEEVNRQVDKALSNTTTLNDNIYSAFKKELVSDYDRLMTYEVLDKTCPSQFITGRVRTTYGDWIYIKYDLIEEGLWTHPLTGYFRPPGWCQLIGHPIKTTKDYAANSLMEFSRDPLIQALFVKSLLLEPHDVPNGFTVGMKLEVLDPFDHVMRVGTIEKILRFSFLLIRFDHDEKTLCFHVTSPLIYPSTFAELNGIPMYDQNNHRFFWKTYELQPGESRAPTTIFPQKRFNCRLKEGMILETFNLRGHGVISYAIILRVVGRILLIDFIHHSSANGLLVDCESPCLYPVGFTNILQVRDRNIRFDIFPMDEFRDNVIENLRLIKMNNEPQLHQLPQPQQPPPQVMDITDDDSVHETIEVEPEINLEEMEQNENQQPVTVNEEVVMDSSSLQTVPIHPDAVPNHQPARPNPHKDEIVALLKSHIEEDFYQEQLEKIDPKLISLANLNDDATFSEVCRSNSQVFNSAIWLKDLPGKIEDWTVADVYNFLSKNTRLCKYAHVFTLKNIDGKAFMKLAEDKDELSRNYIENLGDVLKFQLLYEKLKDQLKRN